MHEWFDSVVKLWPFKPKTIAVRFLKSDNPLTMDPGKIVDILRSTLQPDQRDNAEKQLSEVSIVRHPVCCNFNMAVALCVWFSSHVDICR